LSFFDEVEEETQVQPAARESRRPRGRGSRPPGGGGGRPPRGGRRSGAEEQAIRVRRAVALVALVILLVLIVIGVHSCAVSQANSALRNYSDSVASLMRASNQNGQQMFGTFSGGLNANNATSVQSQVDTARLTASNQLSRAEGLGAPDAVKTAQQYLVFLMKMRRDGITNIAGDLQGALQSATATSAVNSIAAEMARLYGSDVIYKDYVLPDIVVALHKASIAVGGANGEPIESGQLLPNVQWVLPSYVAQQLKISVPVAGGTSSGKAAPGVHGHSLDSCSIGGSALSTTAATTVPTGTAPTLSCQVTNDGANTETNVVVSASISGTSVTGQGVIPQTQPGQQYTVQISLSSAPPAGTYDMVVNVHHVPGETTFTHNSKTFPVTFG
jgi:CARDB